MVHTPTWAWVALPELIFNRLLCAGEDNFFFFVKTFSAESSLFLLFKTSPVPAGKKSALYNPSVFLQVLIVVNA